MDVPSLILPVFAVIVTGWLAGALGYLPRSLSGQIVLFAYNVAMPALVFQTIAKSPLQAMLDWRFLVAFGGGSGLCFIAVLLFQRCVRGHRLAGSAMAGAAASMTNTGFVALPILQALYGAAGVLPAAIATVFIAVVMFPPVIILLEHDSATRTGAASAPRLLKAILLNPVMISTLAGLAWSASGATLPVPVATFLGIFADALTPCALFSIGLGLTLDDFRGLLRTASAMTVLKLIVLPLIVLGLARACGLGHTATIAAVICAAVPTAKTAYMLAGAYRVEESMVAATVSLSTVGSVATLLVWLFALQG